MSKIADTAVRMMRDQDIRVIMFGDGLLVDIAANAGSTVEHPLNKMQATLAALGKDDRFERYYVRGMDSRARSRVVRAFRLKEVIA